ncbi:MAG: HAD hydrolase family protein [Bacteroidetes bacterium]|nr:HAD hydrolase family protein [Bacteroidota bacterium]MDA1121185.1 HAD hydrolase family protein [Bacteroidota bacterium]
MSLDQKRIAFVPVRCGSQSIELKNIKNFCGRPLVFWVTSQLQKSASIDQIIIATDCDEIASIVQGFKFPKVEIYRRDSENATDEASTESVLMEYLSKVSLAKTDLVFLVQATSPFTLSKDFDGALKKFQLENADSLLSGTKFKRFLWDYSGDSLNYNYEKRPRRQDFKGTFLENGAFYISSVKQILDSKNRLSGKIGLYEMPDYTSLELDEPDDWSIGEQLMTQKGLNFGIGNRPKICLADNDGVLTDGGVYYSSKGEKISKYSRIDGKGFELLRNDGIKTGIITSENSAIVKRRAEKLELEIVRIGVKDKLQEIQKICTDMNISIADVAYIGDDVNDLAVLESVGIAACPSNANDKVKNTPNILRLSKRGGEGAFREFSDYLLSLS